jgi:hypothetical protein
MRGRFRCAEGDTNVTPETLSARALRRGSCECRAVAARRPLQLLGGWRCADELLTGKILHCKGALLPFRGGGWGRRRPEVNGRVRKKPLTIFIFASAVSHDCERQS